MMDALLVVHEDKPRDAEIGWTTGATLSWYHIWTSQASPSGQRNGRGLKEDGRNAPLLPKHGGLRQRLTTRWLHFPVNVQASPEQRCTPQSTTETRMGTEIPAGFGLSHSNSRRNLEPLWEKPVVLHVLRWVLVTLQVLTGLQRRGRSVVPAFSSRRHKATPCNLACNEEEEINCLLAFFFELCVCSVIPSQSMETCESMEIWFWVWDGHLVKDKLCCFFRCQGLVIKENFCGRYLSQISQEDKWSHKIDPQSGQILRCFVYLKLRWYHEDGVISCFHEVLRWVCFCIQSVLKIGMERSGEE